MENINRISDDILSIEDKEWLKKQIDFIIADINSKNKKEAGKKLSNILKYIGDKSIDVIIQILPSIGNIATILQNL